MADKVLIVDDEQNILNSFTLNLKRRYEVHTAIGPREALDQVAKAGPFKVVVSDYRMPVMNGIELLEQIRVLAPNTVRVMLTGHADLEMAISAVNQGQVFRFLTKPCSMDLLIGAIEAGIEQYRLQTLEKDLLKNTLLGSIKVFTDILSLVNPEAFGRSERVRRVVVALAKALKVKNPLKYELAAMLSQIGCVNVPEHILTKKYSGKKLTQEEQQIFEMNIPVAVSLIANIPRLEEVSRIIACQKDSHCSVQGEAEGGNLLRIALEYDDLLQSGLNRDQAVQELARQESLYGRDLLHALERFVKREDGYSLSTLNAEELTPGMVLARDLRAMDGGLMLSKGLEINRAMLDRLASVTKTRRVQEPILVYKLDEID